MKLSDAVKLSDAELFVIFYSPEALTALVNHHGQQETMADGMDDAEAANFHKSRREVFELLRTKAETRRAEQRQ